MPKPIDDEARRLMRQVLQADDEYKRAEPGSKERAEFVHKRDASWRDLAEYFTETVVSE